MLKSTDGVNYTIDGDAYVATDPYDITDIVINELYANADSGQTEWVELYNPAPYAIDISGAYIDDISGGGAAKLIPNGTTIAAGGYWTLDTNNLFNNGGDDVRFLMPDGTTVIDSYTYTSSAKNQSWYRTPDGGAWSGTMTSTLTKGAANP